MLIATLVQPAVLLITSHPDVQALKERITRRCSHQPEDGTYKQTLHLAGIVQQEVISTMVQMIAAAVFGCVVPPLLCLLPLLIWAQLGALNIVKRTKRVSFGLTIASNILVQKPLRMFILINCTLSCMVNVWIFVDLGFGLPAIILYGILFVWTISWASYRWHTISRRPRAVCREVIHFNKQMAPRMIHFGAPTVEHQNISFMTR